jgi:hypothetical protein
LVAPNLERAVTRILGGYRRRDPAPARALPATVAWLAGPLAVGFGLSAHVVSGGQAPPLTILLALGALVSMLASLLSRLAAPGWLLLALSGLIQQILHFAFAFLPAGVGGGQARHGHTITWGTIPFPRSADVEHMGDVLLVSHIAAALLTGVVLWKAGDLLHTVRSRR